MDCFDDHYWRHIVIVQGGGTGSIGGISANGQGANSLNHLTLSSDLTTPAFSYFLSAGISGGVPISREDDQELRRTLPKVCRSIQIFLCPI